MGISKCSYCGRERSASKLEGDLVSHGICEECNMKEFEASDEDISSDMKNEIGQGYSLWNGEWPLSKDRPDIVLRVENIRKELFSKEGNEGKKR